MRFRGFFSSWVRAVIFSVCVICFSVRVLGVSAQSVGIAYCDVDRFYDTIPALFYNDSGFTPEGHLRWTSERYTNKVARVAALADSLASLPCFIASLFLLGQLAVICCAN